MFYFIPQTGVILSRTPSVSNFYIYHLHDSHRQKVDEAVMFARVGASGLEYEQGFIDWLNENAENPL